MQTLVQEVTQWGVNKVLDKVGHLAQAKYTLKETAELLDAYADRDLPKINDAIGDILVTLIVGASNDDAIYEEFVSELENDKYSQSMMSTTENLKFSMSHLVQSTFKLIFTSKSYTPSIIDYLDCLHDLSNVKDFINDSNDEYCSLQWCLQLAYNEIKDRTGHTDENGHFIKDN